MIEIIVQGGFGNQLFQYAMGYALARRFNRQLRLNISFFDYTNAHIGSSTPRINNLDKLKLSNVVFVNEPASYKRIMWGARLHKTWLSLLFGFKYPVLWEDVHNCRNYQPQIIEKVQSFDSVSLYGFWQNTNYFDNNLSDLKEQFVPNYSLSESVQMLRQKIERYADSVGVHIRRGDFVKLGWAAGEEYYVKAMRYMRDEKPGCRFFIVTDDKSWACDRFSNMADVDIVDINSSTCDVDEFFLLSLCHHQIISESTFGWWAAYLNTYPNRRIIVPSTVKGEMFPALWIRI